MCVPNCAGRVCGPDGCGGTCGACPANSTCAPAQNTCLCNAGFVPNQQQTACVQIGGPCNGISKYGYCSGSIWVRCDAAAGVVALDCGPGNCKTIDAQGTGACTCGNITEDGLCVNADFSAGDDVLLACLPGYNVLVAQNCVEETGSASGHCSTLVTPFGYVTSCMCAHCAAVNTSGVCSTLCPGMQCGKNSASNYYYCY